MRYLPAGARAASTLPAIEGASCGLSGETSGTGQSVVQIEIRSGGGARLVAFFIGTPPVTLRRVLR